MFIICYDLILLFSGPAFGVRHVQILLLFWMKFLIYSMRYNLSVAIVAMTENTSSNSDIPVSKIIHSNKYLCTESLTLCPALNSYKKAN